MSKIISGGGMTSTRRAIQVEWDGDPFDSSCNVKASIHTT